MGVFIAKHKWYRKQKVVVFPKRNFILVEINHSPGQSVLLKIKGNGPVNCFSQNFWFLCFRSPPKGSFGRILTMQLEPPKRKGAERGF